MKTFTDLEKQVNSGKIIEYDFSNGLGTNYCVVDFSKKSFCEIDIMGGDDENDFSLCYEGRIELYRVKSNEDIKKDALDIIDLKRRRLRSIDRLTLIFITDAFPKEIGMLVDTYDSNKDSLVYSLTGNSVVLDTDCGNVRIATYKDYNEMR